MLIGAKVGVGGRIGLGKEVLADGQHLHLKFDEVIHFLVILGGHNIDEFCSGVKDKIGCVIGESVDIFNNVDNATSNGLCREFGYGGFGKCFDKEGTKFCKGLVTLGVWLPICRLLVEIASTFCSSFEEGKVMTVVRKNAKLLIFCLILSSCLNLVRDFQSDSMQCPQCTCVLGCWHFQG